jgi:O-antigen biosynthesis protein WbqP
MLPGITGWAQVNGRDHMGISQKVWFDVEYMRSQSLQMDIRIIMMTALKVLTREGILH